MKTIALSAITLMALTGCQSPENTLVRLAAHDSFVIGEELIAQFESETGYELEILRLGDTGAVTNQLVLTKNAPVADAFFGIDNTFLGRAESEGVFVDDPTAIDYSDVCFNYDLEWFEQEALDAPLSWRELVNEEYRDLTVITNPNFSSPGLAFLASTYAAFDSATEVESFWVALESNGVKVAGSWEDAYFSDFTRYGGNHPIVLSYASSPAAEVLDDGTPGSEALRVECFRQTEYAGVIEGSANESGAAALVEFLGSPEFQASVPEAMYVYPAVPGIEIPESWAAFAQPATSTIGENLDINANREQWLGDWSTIFDG
ncbi:MAG: thiamine ABC transporter substrate-binding protein [Pontimonas sp.]|jgi:thiamine transport system substrate-binding protein|tara:strand:+ start:1140 stop:2093 length:954 start_codon:yes stop_codon:yes gene_type:complete